MNEYKNILITGGCGFIGSNFINYIFNTTKFNIINIDKFNYCSDENNILKNIRKSPRYTLYKIDIANQNLMLKILNVHNIDLIIHFAAQTHVSNSFNDYSPFIQDNIIATYNLLESVKIYSKIKLFIHISTDEVYGESLLKDVKKKNENSILNPSNPYAASKAATEMIVKSFFYSYKIPIIVTRCNNVYGINQYKEKVIPKFINQIINNKKITIEGSGNQKRTFIHTDDVAEAIITIIEKGIKGEIYNIGNNDNEFTILEIAHLILKYLNKKNHKDYIEFIKDRLYNDERYYIDYSKLKSLGWNHKVNIEDKFDTIIKSYLEKKS